MKKFYLVLILAFLLSISITEAQENQTITQEEALEALLQTEKDIEEMVEAGFGTAYVNDTLIEAKNAFEGVNYTELLEEVEKINETEKKQRARELLIEAQKVLGKEVNYTLVLEKTKTIADRKRQAFEISDSLRALELSIEELDKTGLNTTEAREIYNSALTAFQNEVYDEAEELISQGHTKLTEIRAEATLLKVMIKSARENIITFVKENWLGILITVIILSAVGYVVFDKTIIIRTKHKLRDLKIEKKVLMNLIKKSQADHFQKRSISRETYEIKIKKFKERILEIKEIMPVLKTRLEKKSKRKNLRKPHKEWI